MKRGLVFENRKGFKLREQWIVVLRSPMSAIRSGKFDVMLQSEFDATPVDGWVDESGQREVWAKKSGGYNTFEEAQAWARVEEQIKRFSLAATLEEKERAKSAANELRNVFLAMPRAKELVI